MEQIITFLMEYTVWLCAGLGALTVILLGAALHRIKKVGRVLRAQNEKLQEEMERILTALTQQEAAAEVRPAKEQQEKKAENPVADEMDQVSLIHEVLEEVFP